MKSSFNAYGRTSDGFGTLSIPIWLGKVEPVPVGGTLDRGYLKAGALYQAGCPINLTGKVIKPLVVMEVTAVKDGVLTVNVGGYGLVPEVGDYIQKAGEDLSSPAAAVQVTAVAKTDTKGVYDVTAAVEGAAAGDAVLLSPTSDGAAVPNAYLYNDIFIGKDFDTEDESTSATGAAVMYHQSGILIDRTPASLIQKQMKALVPGVYQHNE